MRASSARSTERRRRAMADRGGRRGERPKRWLPTLLRIWSYLAAHRGLLAAIFLMTAAGSTLGLLGPYLLGRAIDDYFVPGDYEGLAALILVLGAVYVAQGAAGWLQNFWMIGVAQRTVAKLRADLFDALHRLPIAYFTKRQHGELMSRMTSDIDNVSQTLNSSFIQLVSSLLTFAGMLGLMLWLSPLMTLITLTTVPVMFAGMRWITNRTSRYFRETQRNTGALNGFVEETLSGQRVVKSFSRERAVIEAFREKNDRLRESAYWAQVYSGFIPKLMNMLNNMSFAVIALAGGLLTLKGIVSVGIIVTFAEYARQFTRPLNDLANQFNTFLSAVAGAERVFEVIDEKEETVDEGGAKPIGKVRGEIVFENVSFAYEPGVPTIENVSFRAEAGEMIALIGPTGAGKTTIVHLLARFYDPDSGRILIDGRDIRGVTRRSLRQAMGFVPQDVFLFEGTIRENIRYGRLDATDEEVEQAARAANAHRFIMKLPQGYDTMLRPDGGGISQGQRQLLAIARVFLADPAILVLDEATSSIDTITELHIREALQRLMAGRTSIVIAHRLNTIRRADRILVLDRGRIIEQGTHEELMALSGFYSSLVRSGRQTVSAGAE
ncbi:MAG: multidrug ABC transporter ATP-binding protein [Thermobacillus sp. ZCTH02-B1]|nr:MAG: multidrug ABC transporter ATP-binding protein [Thermobacillus sp. ZCTH02-B1]